MYKYATQNMTEKMAKAVKTSMSISTKQAVEIAKWIKGRSPASALQLLEGVVQKKTAVPFTRFNWNMGHKPGGIGPGRYPVKAAQEFISLVKLVVANAADIGLDTDSLIIFNVVAHKGGKQYKPSRIRGQKAKRTHVEIVVEEKVSKDVKPKAKAKAVKQVETKQESAEDSQEGQTKKPAVKKAKKAPVADAEVAE
jgi:large subunit ribosomal protein L22